MEPANKASRGARPASPSARSKTGSGAEATGGAQATSPEQGSGEEVQAILPCFVSTTFFPRVGIYLSCMYNAHSFKKSEKMRGF